MKGLFKNKNFKNLIFGILFFIGIVIFPSIWYLILAILIIAVPLDLRLKTFLAIIFISVYCSMFLFFYDVKPLYQIEKLTESILGISNILGSLLVLGLPMGMYSIFLEQERNRSEKLLHNIIPKSIADKLKKDSKLISMDNPEISVLFADIVSFTVMSEKTSSEKIVGFLNDMFSKFDDLTESYGVEKIKTIGDSYMVVAGMPVARKDHTLILFNLAKEMVKISETFNDHNGDPIKLRIGLNSGPAVSGVIGKSKFAFDVWGDTINTAARLESYGSPDCIHMTKDTYELLNKKEEKVEEKSIEIRGKGLMDTVLVNVQ